MPIQDMVDSIATSANLDPQVAEKAAGTVLSVLQHEAPEQASVLFAKIPGAAQLAQTFDVMAAGNQSGGGLLSSITGFLGGAAGEKVGAILNGVAALKASGLTVEQIQQAGSAVIAHAKQSADPQLVDKIVNSVPGLKGHFGL
ncbi:DUF2267 domain-containing protein (plasmid) [Phyllobacterium sp. 628]|uniref:hypothetical protein n=1 Tax=Phyllobacterium sp. 628 TaxID=2718938 RepID=UPI0016624E19|nr:hypothetical protein [Phyllobacterium sp. 628]QND50517.1 DUF2267 domain-containing protein [Phyllobacterium sp. 628]